MAAPCAACPAPSIAFRRTANRADRSNRLRNNTAKMTRSAEVPARTAPPLRGTSVDSEAAWRMAPMRSLPAPCRTTDWERHRGRRPQFDGKRLMSGRMTGWCDAEPSRPDQGDVSLRDVRQTWFYGRPGQMGAASVPPGARGGWRWRSKAIFSPIVAEGYALGHPDEVLMQDRTARGRSRRSRLQSRAAWISHQFVLGARRRPEWSRTVLA